MRVMWLAGGFVYGAVGIAWAEPTELQKLRQQVGSLEPVGDVSTVSVDFDDLDVEISDAPPLGTVRERKAPRIPGAVAAAGTASPRLGEEVATRFRELELCRTKVARARGVPITQVPTGDVTLQWTIETSGRTRNTALLEAEGAKGKTDDDLERCVERRMRQWSFTPPTGGAVTVEYEYSFSAAAKK